MTDGTDRDSRDWMRSVLERYEGPLVRYAARITGDLERGRDVAQETFLRLWRRRDEVGADHLRRWLFTVCRNRALDVRRKEGRQRRLGDASSLAAAAAGPAAAAERHDLAALARRALAALPGKEREVIRLRLEEGLSYREIAAVTGLTVSNVGFLIHTGLKRIRRRLAAMGLLGGGR